MKKKNSTPPKISLAIENSQNDTLSLLERAITEDESTPSSQTIITIRIETKPQQRSVEDVR